MKKSERHPITFEMINKAVTNLYGNWDAITEEAKEFVEKVLFVTTKTVNVASNLRCDIYGNLS